MNNERLLPIKSTYDVVSSVILLNKEPMDNTYQVLSIVITKEVNRIPTARITIIDGEAAAEDFPISNKADFIPGTEVEIQVGRDGTNKTVFKGIIIKHGIKVSANGSTYLSVECKHECVKMSIGRKNKYFEKKKDSDAIKQLLGKLAGKIETTKVQHDELVQHYSTDWDFLLCRAEANGLLVVPDNDKVEVKAPSTKEKENLTLIFGETLFEFEAEMDARHQYKKVKASGWNYAKQDLEKGIASSVTFDENGNLSGTTLADVIGLEEYERRHSGNMSTGELKAWAKACLLKSRLAKIRGRAKCKGLEEIKPGAVVKLKGVGDRFNGKVYVTAVKHEITDNSWYSHTQFGLSPQWFYEEMDVVDDLAGGLMPGIHGLQIGKVVKMYDDKEHRVQVKLPIIDDQAKGVWARVASLDAGKNRGAFFRPEEGDEVVVGFVNGDPRDPVIVGMLHSSKLPAPITADKKNTEKGFVTRSEMKLIFNDVDKVITIETPAGNSIVITEKDKAIEITDQNDNKITMDKKGIELDSPKDIKLNAKGKIELKADKDVTIKGLNVSAKANKDFEAKGQAGAKLQSSGKTVIKGGMVNIN